MKVEQLKGGQWVVLDDAGEILSKHVSNEEAWRELDRLNVEVGMKADCHSWSFVDNAHNSGERRRR